MLRFRILVKKIEKYTLWEHIYNNLNRMDMQNSSEFKRFTRCSNKFSSESLKHTERNKVFSPLGIVFLLSSLHLGSSNKTFEELSKILGDRYHPSILSDIHKIFKGFELGMANLLVYHKDHNIEQVYLDDVSSYMQTFGSDFSNLEDLANMINKFVYQNTNGLIDELITAAQLNNVNFAMMNTIYFDQQWAKPFKKANTKPDLFNNSLNVQMMRKRSRFYYYEDNDVQVVKILYYNSYRMIIVMPKDDQKLTKIYHPSSYSKKMKEEYLELYLPKFDIKCRIDFKKVLSEIGINTLFKSANLKGITNKDTYISDIFQEIIFSTDENGTKATAASMMIGKLCMKFKKTIEPTIVKINKSFFFSIVHEKTNSIIFDGSYTGE